MFCYFRRPRRPHLPPPETGREAPGPARRCALGGPRGDSEQKPALHIKKQLLHQAHPLLRDRALPPGAALSSFSPWSQGAPPHLRRWWEGVPPPTPGNSNCPRPATFKVKHPHSPLPCLPVPEASSVHGLGGRGQGSPGRVVPQPGRHSGTAERRRGQAARSLENKDQVRTSISHQITFPALKGPVKHGGKLTCQRDRWAVILAASQGPGAPPPSGSHLHRVPPHSLPPPPPRPGAGLS